MARYTAMEMPGSGQAPAAVERDVPSPGPGQVLVRLRATSCNYHDLVNLAGQIPGPWPRVPMSDGAGEVVATGRDVKRPAAGDQVILPFFPRWLDGPPTPAGKRAVPGDTHDGHLQQFVCVDARAVVPAPAHLTSSEAATLGCAGVTAWNALRAAAVKPGDTVVVQGTGGVAVLALQLAKAHGARVIVISSSDDKLAVAASLGADDGVNYHATPEWHKEVRALTAGRGADAVIDVGGPDTLGRSVRATRMAGTVAVVGVLSGFGNAEIPVALTMAENTHLVGVTVGSVADLAALTRAVELVGIRPHISHTFGWDELALAVKTQQGAQHVGKISIEIP